MKKIIDISSWQGLIDYDKVAKSNKVDGVILRSSIGNSTDNKFFEYVDGFHKVDIPVIGVYHFSHAINPDEAAREAALAVSNVEKAGLPKSTIIFFDYEYESLEKIKNKTNMSDSDIKSMINKMIKKFTTMIISAGYKSGVYFNFDFYNTWFDHSIIDSNIKWYADWRGSRSLACDIWQYGTTIVEGINGKVDANEAYIDFNIEVSLTHKKSNEEVANDVIKGLYSVGEARKKKLESEGYDYKTVQDIVNKKMEAINKTTTHKKSNEEIANDVIRGLYGVGEDRKKKLESEGYDYKTVQDIVNKKTNGTFNKISPAKRRDTSLSGTYVVTAEALNLRYVPGLISYDNVITVIKKNTKIHNYGYYTDVNGKRWLYIQFGNYVGHIDSSFVRKV